MIALEFIALFSCGTFFGAAIYISLVQHPAALEAGTDVGARFFPPMYSRAAPMQIVLAVVGGLAAISSWFLGSSLLWLIGAIFLLLVIPITLVLIKPINDVLLDETHSPEAEDTEDLLRRWGSMHWLRSISSGIAFLIFLSSYAVT